MSPLIDRKSVSSGDERDECPLSIVAKRLQGGVLEMRVR